MGRKEKEADYFRIGIFVIVGVVLIIVAVAMFGSAGLFKSNLYVETYFNESVQGLTVGSDVKYRGINIGEVKKIGLVSTYYDLPPKDAEGRYGRYIYVLMAIDPDIIPNTTKADVAELLKRDIKQGLRVKMSLAGLTGGAYLELNFSDDNGSTAPVLPIKWKPKHIYIPSEPSTLTQLGDSAQAILSGLKDVDFAKVFNSLQELVQKSDRLAQRSDQVLKQTQSAIIATMNNTRIISANLRDLTASLKANPSSLLNGQPQQVDASKL